MKETKTWTIAHRLSHYTPYGFRKNALDATRRAAGLEVFDVIWEQKLPCVVDIDEKITDVYLWGVDDNPDTLIEIKISVTPV